MRYLSFLLFAFSFFVISCSSTDAEKEYPIRSMGWEKGTAKYEKDGGISIKKGVVYDAILIPSIANGEKLTPCYDFEFFTYGEDVKLSKTIIDDFFCIWRFSQTNI